MKREGISGEHYFRIKILHQHGLNFLTGFQCEQPRSQQISSRNRILQVLQCSLWVFENLLESWESTLVSSPSELKQKTKELGLTGGFWLLTALPFHCASLYSLCSGPQKWLRQLALSWQACQLGITQHHLNVYTPEADPNVFC